ncbi:hypothetical protein P7C73_g3611, partial [Tremellales sp. Uapishka_1]
MIYSLPIVLAACVSSALATPPIVVNTPGYLEECHVANLTWTGGRVPYYVIVQTANLTGAEGTQYLSQGSVEHTWLAFTVEIPAGTSVSIGVSTEDQTNVAYSQAVTVGFQVKGSSRQAFRKMLVSPTATNADVAKSPALSVTATVNSAPEATLTVHQGQQANQQKRTDIAAGADALLAAGPGRMVTLNGPVVGQLIGDFMASGETYRWPHPKIGELAGTMIKSDRKTFSQVVTRLVDINRGVGKQPGGQSWDHSGQGDQGSM